MKIFNLIAVILLIIVSCKNQVRDDTNKEEEIQIKTVKEEIVFDLKCVILYMPDSIELASLEKKKSQEELMSIEYDKTMAIEFLDGRNNPVFIEDEKLFKFKKTTGDILVIDKTSYQNWGIILFSPDKDPKVIFLNDIVEEYNNYFGLE